MELEIFRLPLIVIGILIGLLVLLESVLQLRFGLGNPSIYQANEEIGYLLAPNQNIRRFGNRIRINQYSMRSDPIECKRSHDTTRILILGDSIANGAWWTDQADTIPSLIQQNLTKANFQNLQVLNASANSWGPRNQLAYLKRFGTFDAQVVVLLMNTDDLFSLAPSSLVVGRDMNYPDRKPPLAFIELFDRYFPKKKPLAVTQPKEKDTLSTNLGAVEEIGAICRQNNAQFLITITPLLREIEEPPREYEQKAKSRLQMLAQTAFIPYVDFLPSFQTIEPSNTLYRDRIHLSPQGNRQVSQTLSQSLIELLR